MGVFFGKFNKIKYVGPSEGVDALVVVTYYADIVIWLGNKLENSILQGTGVLILVNK
jgi:hypothetical protein